MSDSVASESGPAPAYSASSPSSRRGLPIPWVVLAMVMFVVYARSFSGFPQVEQVLGSVGKTVPAPYIRLWHGFSLSTPMGDKYRAQGRTFDDVAEKHRVHHPLSAAAGHALVPVFAAVYRAIGLPEREAPFVVNALWGALNILLLGMLLRRWGDGRPILPFLVLYAVSLTPWVHSAMPDSWQFTVVLLQVFLLLAASPRVPMTATAAVLGVFMLNNMAMGAIILFLWLARWHEPPRLGALVRRVLLLTGITLATWIAGLTVLSLFDPAFRLDHLMAYSAWFRRYLGGSLPVWDSYVWKGMLSTLFVTAIATNQADPDVPVEALLYTLQGSWLGRLAVLALVATYGLAAYRGWTAWRAWRRRGGNLVELFGEPGTAAAAFCVVMVFVNLALYPGGSFTYANILVPVLIVALFRGLDLRRWPERAVVLAAVLLVVINNVDEIAGYRAVLGG